MPRLAELQRRFLAGLTGAEPASAYAGLRVAHGPSLAARYAVYRGNVHENARQALAVGFAVTAALGGESWFEGQVADYLAAEPGPSGNVSDLGAALPAFLEARLGAGRHAFISEVARLEWAYQQAMVAADAAPLAAQALAAVAPEDHARLVLHPHPGLRTVDARSRVLDVWRAHQPGGPAPESVDPYAGPQFVACLRRAGHIELAALPAGDAILLKAFARGLPLAAAALELEALEPVPALGHALQQLFAAGYLGGFSLAPD